MGAFDSTGSADEHSPQTDILPELAPHRPEFRYPPLSEVALQTESFVPHDIRVQLGAQLEDLTSLFVLWGQEHPVYLGNRQTGTYATCPSARSLVLLEEMYRTRPPKIANARVLAHLVREYNPKMLEQPEPGTHENSIHAVHRLMVSSRYDGICEGPTDRVVRSLVLEALGLAQATLMARQNIASIRRTPTFLRRIPEKTNDQYRQTENYIQEYRYFQLLAKLRREALQRTIHSIERQTILNLGSPGILWDNVRTSIQTVLPTGLQYPPRIHPAITSPAP